MDHFVEYLSDRLDATAFDLKTTLHEHVDPTVDSKVGQFKRELPSMIRSGVVESIRAQGINQHWLVETTYTPVSPYQHNLPLEVPSIASNSIGIIQGIPPFLLPHQEESTASVGMPATAQCIADVTFPSFHSMSIPLYDINRSNYEDISEQSTHDQLPFSGVSTDFSNLSNVYLNNTEQNTASVQTINSNEQFYQNPLGGLVVTTPMDQFHPNDFPPPSPNHESTKSDEDDNDFCPCPECVNKTLITNQADGGGQFNSGETLNEPNNKSQVGGTNFERPLNGNFPSDDVNGQNSKGPMGTSTEAPLVNFTQLMMTPSTSSGSINTGARSSEDDQNQESTTIQSKRKSGQSNDQANKKAKHVGQIDNAEDGKKIKIIYLNCTESECNEQLNSIDDLGQHLTTKHGLLPYQCFVPGCNVRCDNPYNLQSHLRREHPTSTEFVCPSCAKLFPSQTSVKSHRYSVHLKGKFQCNIVDECKFEGATRQEMYVHLQRCKQHRPM